MTAPAVLFHVQHLLGIGHLKRTMVLAQAMQHSGLEVTVVSGGEAVPVIEAGNVRFVQLPAARAADRSFKVLVDDNGAVIDDAWKDRRRDRLLALFAELRPAVLAIELFPFGRRQLRYELLPLLQAARDASPRPAVVSSVRDILVAKDRPERNREMVETAQTYFDAVLVHGDPALIPFDATFPFARDLGSQLRYTGYVVDPAAELTGGGARRGVVVSAGGGAVGDEVLRMAMLARPLTRLAGEPWHLLAGHNMTQEAFMDLAARAPAGVTVERARPDFISLLRAARLSVSQGGYNTVMELLATRTPGVIVPYAGGEETEQMIRARLLAERGLVTLADEVGLTPERLADAVDAALDLPLRRGAPPRLDGARECARIVAELACRGRA